jgi:hypothetical protein
MDEMIPAIKQAASFTDELSSAAKTMTEYAVCHLRARRDAVS